VTLSGDLLPVLDFQPATGTLTGKMVFIAEDCKNPLKK